MPKWEEITDYEAARGEISQEIIIFLLIADSKEKENFEKKYLKTPKTIAEINVGD